MSVFIKKFSLLASVILSSEAIGQSVVLHGGPLAGLSRGTVEFANGHIGQGLIRSVPNSSPVPQDYLTVILNALSIHAAATPHDFSSVLAADAKEVDCPHADDCGSPKPFEDFPVPAWVTPNVPYYVGGQVRIEWLTGDRLDFLSFVDFKDGKIQKVRSMPADPPA